MAKFHLNSRGEVGKCTAQQGRCPFGEYAHVEANSITEAQHQLDEKLSKVYDTPNVKLTDEELEGKVEFLRNEKSSLDNEIRKVNQEFNSNNTSELNRKYNLEKEKVEQEFYKPLTDFEEEHKPGFVVVNKETTNFGKNQLTSSRVAAFNGKNPAEYAVQDLNVPENVKQIIAEHALRNKSKHWAAQNIYFKDVSKLTESDLSWIYYYKDKPERINGDIQAIQSKTQEFNKLVSEYKELKKNYNPSEAEKVIQNNAELQAIRDKINDSKTNSEDKHSKAIEPLQKRKAECVDDINNSYNELILRKRLRKSGFKSNNVQPILNTNEAFTRPNEVGVKHIELPDNLTTDDKGNINNLFTSKGDKISKIVESEWRGVYGYSESTPAYYLVDDKGNHVQLNGDISYRQAGEHNFELILDDTAKGQPYKGIRKLSKIWTDDRTYD